MYTFLLRLLLYLMQKVITLVLTGTIRQARFPGHLEVEVENLFPQLDILLLQSSITTFRCFSLFSLAMSSYEIDF